MKIFINFMGSFLGWLTALTLFYYLDNSHYKEMNNRLSFLEKKVNER